MSKTIFLLLFPSLLSAASACLYSATQCQCSIDNTPGKCVRYQSGSDASATCYVDDCQAGNYKCDCFGDSLCNISPCDAWVPSAPLTGTESNGDSVGCSFDPAGSATARVCPTYLSPLSSTSASPSPSTTQSESATPSPSSTLFAILSSTPSSTPSASQSPSVSPSPGAPYEVRIGPAAAGADMFDMPRFTDVADIAFINSPQTPGSQVTWSYPELLRKHYLNVRLYEDAANSETIACIIYNRFDAVPETAYSISVDAVLTAMDGQTLTNKLCDDYLVAPETPECTPASGNVINYSHSMFFSETDGFCFSNLHDGLVRLQFTNLQFFRGIAFQGPTGQYRDYEFASSTLPPYISYSALDLNSLTLGGSFDLYIDIENKINQVGPPNSPTPTPSPSASPSVSPSVTPSVTPSVSPSPLPKFEVRIGPEAANAEMFDLPRFTDAGDLTFMNTPQTPSNQITWSYPALLRKHWIQIRLYEDTANSETIACIIYNRYDAALEDAYSMSAEATVTGLNGQAITTKLCDDYLVAPDTPECIPTASESKKSYKHSMFFSENDGFCFSNLQDGPIGMQFWNLMFFQGITFQGPTGQIKEFEFSSSTLPPYISYHGLDSNNLSLGGSFSLFIDVASKLQQVNSPSPTPTVSPVATSYEVRIGPAASDAEMFDVPRFYDSADLYWINQPQNLGGFTWAGYDPTKKHYLHFRIYEDVGRSETVACVVYNRYTAALEDAYSMSVDAVLTGLNGQTLTNKICDDNLIAPDTPECSPTSGNVINYSHSMYFSETDGFCFSNLRDGPVQIQFTNMQFFEGILVQSPNGAIKQYEFASPTLPPYMLFSALDVNGLTTNGNFVMTIDTVNKLQQVP